MSESTGNQLLRYFVQKLKAFFFSKDILSFLLFLALSAMLWFVHTLGKECETTVSIPIRYVGIPPQYAVINHPPSVITFTLRDQGVRLFSYSSRFNGLTINLSKMIENGRHKHKFNHISISTEQIRAQIVSSLGLLPTTNIQGIRPDSINIQFQHQRSKRLPVKLVAQFETAHQHMYSSNMQINPEWITVYGPSNLLDTMKYVYTEKITETDLNDTTRLEAKIKKTNLVRYNISKVNITLFIESFTEKTTQIPVTSINCPEGYTLRTFPAMVHATYTVGVSYFNKLKPEDIQIYVDYNDLIDKDQTRQTLRIKNNSMHISNVRVIPNEVEFILEKN